MNQSENINDIASALAKAQGSYKPLEKTRKGQKNNYADLLGIIQATRDALSINGIAFIQTTLPMEGAMFLESKLVHSSGQWLRSLWPLDASKGPVNKEGRAVMSPEQAQGSALTYAKRYQAKALLGIEETDADDLDDHNHQDRPYDYKPEPTYIPADAVVKQKTPVKPEEAMLPITMHQVSLLLAEIGTDIEMRNSMLNKYGQFEGLSQGQFVELMTWVKKKHGK